MKYCVWPLCEFALYKFDDGMKQDANLLLHEFRHLKHAQFMQNVSAILDW